MATARELIFVFSRELEEWRIDRKELQAEVNFLTDLTTMYSMRLNSRMNKVDQIGRWIAHLERKSAILEAWAQSFTSMTLKLGGRGASVASDPYGGLGGLPPSTFYGGAHAPRCLRLIRGNTILCG